MTATYTLWHDWTDRAGDQHSHLLWVYEDRDVARADAEALALAQDEGQHTYYILGSGERDMVARYSVALPHHR